MTIDNRQTEIPAVYPEQMAMALALFRAAALDETVEESYPPAQRSRHLDSIARARRDATWDWSYKDSF